MSNRYGCFTPLPPERRSQMAKDAAKTRRILHPTKDDIIRGAQYLSSLSEIEQQKIYRARNNQVSIFSILMGLAFMSIPLLFIALWFG